MADGRVKAVHPALAENRILAVFVRENAGLSSALQLVAHTAGQVIHRQDGPMYHAYFPLTGSMVITIDTQEGAACEAAAVGNEGVLGLSIYLGLPSSPNTVVQQIDGRSYRLAAATFLEAIRKSEQLERLMHRYAAYAIRAAQQTAACNTLHTLRQRACRWLLMVQDRAASSQFELPQSKLADLLGVRRQSVSEVATELRRAGLIEYRRGIITIANRRKLESAACCECYGQVNAFYERMMGEFR
ncbi:MAG TPA: Crp/Fnr family transcriptional regulator [Steroidobacteraceae bacterium]|nr:Crp/Fnr family transcriptional regulator [Steroidobacteraceae bacterium]